VGRGGAGPSSHGQCAAGGAMALSGGALGLRAVWLVWQRSRSAMNNPSPFRIPYSPATYNRMPPSSSERDDRRGRQDRGGPLQGVRRRLRTPGQLLSRVSSCTPGLARLAPTASRRALAGAWRPHSQPGRRWQGAHAHSSLSGLARGRSPDIPASVQPSTPCTRSDNRQFPVAAS
jgi:hypothetical protein